MPCCCAGCHSCRTSGQARIHGGAGRCWSPLNNDGRTQLAESRHSACSLVSMLYLGKHRCSSKTNKCHMTPIHSIHCSVSPFGARSGKMEPIGSINKRGQAGGVEKFLPSFRSRKCYICGTSIGSAIRCHTSSCKFHLHPMCGSRAGSVYMEIETTLKAAADGTEHEAVNLVAKCPR